MGQTPSSIRQDNASTRTLHSSSIQSRRPISFFRRLSNRLHNHPSRRFGRQRRPTTTTNNTTRTPIEQRRLHPNVASSSASTTSSVRHATAAATRAAAAATGPPPPLPFLDSQFIAPSSSSTSTTSSHASDLRHMLSDIIASAVFPSIARQQETDSERSPSFFRYQVQVPLRHQDDPERMLPIVIVGYRTSSISSQHNSDFPRRRPRSTVSTSSSLATLQSMPLSVHSNRTQPASPTVSTNEPDQWVIYVRSGQPASPVLSENPTYEDLVWLSNIIGPARPVTTTQAAIDATTPVIAWSDDTKHRLRGADRCLVCLDDFEPKQSVRVLKCCHVFHQECVDRWLCETHNSCPVCRGVPVETSP
ncbi:hypothetical protein BJV82DRAFT_310724 [Fennellomyces sp. T-0311]|nr:hypothetical protein BJV82DRAFT_310724 [Fennellomyces sp. T-0311]